MKRTESSMTPLGNGSRMRSAVLAAVAFAGLVSASAGPWTDPAGDSLLTTEGPPFAGASCVRTDLLLAQIVEGDAVGRWLQVTVTNLTGSCAIESPQDTATQFAVRGVWTGFGEYEGRVYGSPGAGWEFRTRVCGVTSCAFALGSADDYVDEANSTILLPIPTAPMEAHVLSFETPCAGGLCMIEPEAALYGDRLPDQGMIALE